MGDGSLTLDAFWRLSEAERSEQYKDLSDHDRFGVRQGMNPGTRWIPCNDCVHKHAGRASCAAFPDGLTAEHIHAVMKDQNVVCGAGYLFERRGDE